MSTLAKVVPIPKGTYSSSATYNSLDIVRYNNRSWMCKQDSITNITPAEGDYWMMIAQDGAGATSLTGLDDVTVSSPSNGQILLYNSTSGKWENNNFTPTSSLGSLTDVTISSVSNGQVLLYNSTSGKWENGAVSISIPTASSSTLGGIKVGKGLSIDDNDKLNLQENIIFGCEITLASSGQGARASCSEGDIIEVTSFLKTIALTNGIGFQKDYTFGHSDSEAQEEFFLSASVYYDDDAAIGGVVNNSPILLLDSPSKSRNGNDIFYYFSGCVAYMATANGDATYMKSHTKLYFNFYRRTWNI